MQRITPKEDSESGSMLHKIKGMVQRPFSLSEFKEALHYLPKLDSSEKPLPLSLSAIFEGREIPQGYDSLRTPSTCEAPCVLPLKSLITYFYGTPIRINYKTQFRILAGLSFSKVDYPAFLFQDDKDLLPFAFMHSYPVLLRRYYNSAKNISEVEMSLASEKHTSNHNDVVLLTSNHFISLKLEKKSTFILFHECDGSVFGQIINPRILEYEHVVTATKITSSRNEAQQIFLTDYRTRRPAFIENHLKYLLENGIVPLKRRDMTTLMEENAPLRFFDNDSIRDVYQSKLKTNAEFCDIDFFRSSQYYSFVYSLLGLDTSMKLPTLTNLQWTIDSLRGMIEAIGLTDPSHPMFPFALFLRLKLSERLSKLLLSIKLLKPIFPFVSEGDIRSETKSEANTERIEETRYTKEMGTGHLRMSIVFGKSDSGQRVFTLFIEIESDKEVQYTKYSSGNSLFAGHVRGKLETFMKDRIYKYSVEEIQKSAAVVSKLISEEDIRQGLFGSDSEDSDDS